ncbi:MAG: sulfite exporter TauE/SafE family protein [Acidobacteriaceae bacterium]|nr:sulfite exporter TauE/SafE family protein [Acidobacteriaceae bacterium]MBV9502076.1 sulfite exporter TauE/SafE family protein [Acidobacteriaceae bacterium]
MEAILGFAIALAISLTGVGAGTLTTPILIIFLGVPPAIAVGTALAFSVIVKVASVPFYALHRNINMRVLGLLLIGGVPGVIVGSLLLDRFKHGTYQKPIFVALGVFITSAAVLRLYRLFRPRTVPPKPRAHWLPWLTFPIGAEVGFSSAGAGALGSLLLLGMTNLSTAEVVGTDLSFGLGLSLVGSGIHVSAGNYDSALLAKLAIGGVLGALTGSASAGRVAQRPLRIALLLTLIALGLRLAWQT